MNSKEGSESVRHDRSFSIRVFRIHLIDPYLCVEDKGKYKQDAYATVTHFYTSPVNHFNTHALHLDCLKGVGGENF